MMTSYYDRPTHPVRRHQPANAFALVLLLLAIGSVVLCLLALKDGML